MYWILFCAITILLYGLHDIILKHLSVHTDALLASLIINASAVGGILVVALGTWNKRSFKVPPTDLFWLLVAGVSLGLATVTFMKAFGSGGAFSITVPVVYIGIIVISLLVGNLFFQEKLSAAQLAGVVLSCIGIYFMTRG